MNSAQQSAESIARALNGHRSGEGWAACCPCHDDRKESFSINVENDKILVHCHRGCSQSAVIQALRDRGLWPSHDSTSRPRATRRRAKQRKCKGRRIVAEYPYRDAAGNVLYKKLRFEPKDFAFDRSLKGLRRILYKLPELIAAPLSTAVFIVEGEKDCDKLATRGFVPTTSPFGGSKTPSQKKWLPEFNESFCDRKVVVIPDNDETGIAFARYVAEQVFPVAAEVRLVTLPNMPNGGDVSDFLDSGGTRERLVDIVNATTKLTALEIEFWKSQSTQGQAGAASATAAPKKSQAGQLIELVLADAELFHDDQVPFAALKSGETLQVGSRRFRIYLQGRYFKAHGSAPDDRAVKAAIAVVSSKAIFDSNPEKVYTRIGGRDGAIYLDLADQEYRAVEITAHRWRIIERAPVKFRRPRGMEPIPKPERGGTIDDLRPFLNVAHDDDFTLCGAFLIASLRPRGPYPILVIHGEQGSAKSMLTRLLRMLIDPNKSNLRRKPRDEVDLMIAANNGAIVTSTTSPFFKTGSATHSASCRPAAGSASASFLPTKTRFSSMSPGRYC
jgi:hypothetical protein